MLALRISLRNPFRYGEWRNIWQRAWCVTKNKTLEVCLDYYAYELFELDVNTAWRGLDHAGPSFSINLFGLGFRVSFPDNRHWDYVNNRWEHHEL